MNASSKLFLLILQLQSKPFETKRKNGIICLLDFQLSLHIILGNRCHLGWIPIQECMIVSNIIQEITNSIVSWDFAKRLFSHTLFIKLAENASFNSISKCSCFCITTWNIVVRIVSSELFCYFTLFDECEDSILILKMFQGY